VSLTPEPALPPVCDYRRVPRIHACEANDPESKGKVEAGVKYVKP